MERLFRKEIVDEKSFSHEEIKKGNLTLAKKVEGFLKLQDKNTAKPWKCVAEIAYE